jgi:hypothetical protein
MSNFTPGPWKFVMQGGGKGQGGNDYSIRVDCPQSDEGECAVAMVRRKGRNQIARANAKLIAAAPAMFAALVEASAFLTDPLIAEVVRAAIAKAKLEEHAGEERDGKA